MIAQYLKVSKLLIFCLILLSQQVFAGEADILDASVLTQETVLPIVDFPTTIINKNIQPEKKFDISVDIVTKTDDLFYENTAVAFKLGYYLNDDNAFGVSFLSSSKSFNKYAETFQNSSAKLDFTRAPIPQSMLSVYFNQVYFYGKLSFSNDVVLNQIWLGRYSVGMTHYDMGENLPFGSASLSVQTYFNKYSYAELGYGLSVNQVYNPVSQNIRSAAQTVSKQDFSKEIQFSQVLNLGMGFIF